MFILLRSTMADSNPKVSFLRFFCVFVSVILLLKSQIFSFVAAEVDTLGLDPCNEDVSFYKFLPAPYNNLSHLSCETVWNSFILRFIKDAQNVTTIVLSVKYTTGWVGVGFSEHGLMIGSSAMVGWINGEGKGVIKQYYLQGFTTSDVIVDKGELQLTKVPPAIILHKGTIYLVFQLKLPALKNLQQVLLAFGTKTPIHNQLSEHDDKTTNIFDFSAGSMIRSIEDVGLVKRRHGILGITGLGLTLPVGAIIPRYFKHWDPLWYYLHSIVQFMGLFIGFATVLAGLRLHSSLHAHIPIHRGIGISLLVLTFLQMLALLLKPGRESKNRKYWNMYHHWVGRLILFLGAMNIVIGIRVGGGAIAWKITYGFILACILVTVIVLEATLRIRGPKRTLPPAFVTNPVQ